ncbi:rab15 effector protein [Pholidichthys leucotaenia]
MGDMFSKPPPNSIWNCNFLPPFKSDSSRQPPFSYNKTPQPNIFSTLKRYHTCRPNHFIHLFNSCVSAASARTQEYLTFQDPEDKFCPSPEVLTQIFLMTYITESISLNLTGSLNCTVMTPGQRILLGADWVWAVLEKSTKTPKFQIVVQVLHNSMQRDTTTPAEDCSESVRMAQMETGHKDMCERLVDFCTSIGKDCYALFLFFGRKNDRENIYGVLSNNFEAARKCSRINRALIENFLRGSRYLHTPLGMMQAILTKNYGEPLTLMIKFT